MRKHCIKPAPVRNCPPTRIFFGLRDGQETGSELPLSADPCSVPGLAACHEWESPGMDIWPHLFSNTKTIWMTRVWALSPGVLVTPHWVVRWTCQQGKPCDRAGQAGTGSCQEESGVSQGQVQGPAAVMTPKSLARAGILCWPGGAHQELNRAQQWSSAAMTANQMLPCTHRGTTSRDERCDCPKPPRACQAHLEHPCVQLWSPQFGKGNRWTGKGLKEGQEDDGEPALWGETERIISVFYSLEKAPGDLITVHKEWL